MVSKKKEQKICVFDLSALDCLHLSLRQLLIIVQLLLLLMSILFKLFTFLQYSIFHFYIFVLKYNFLSFFKIADIKNIYWNALFIALQCNNELLFNCK